MVIHRCRQKFEIIVFTTELKNLSCKRLEMVAPDFPRHPIIHYVPLQEFYCVIRCCFADYLSGWVIEKPIYCYAYFCSICEARHLQVLMGFPHMVLLPYLLANGFSPNYGSKVFTLVLALFAVLSHGQNSTANFLEPKILAKLGIASLP